MTIGNVTYTVTDRIHFRNMCICASTHCHAQIIFDWSWRCQRQPCSATMVIPTIVSPTMTGFLNQVTARRQREKHHHRHHILQPSDVESLAVQLMWLWVAGLMAKSSVGQRRRLIGLATWRPPSASDVPGWASNFAH